ncbi:hypothetical protein NEMBOFW57_005134 [Staphylotrichum longicolle]|uniref:Glycoside hydrolase family 43 protein n=1 Tax=Staphylotrichum longicolle TaxID=669026 RepID=A0AAD4EW52_9PEZI|nr:hypothetical protein NEMBOFW57_005134 [Staphylotrichum longicolle]
MFPFLVPTSLFLTLLLSAPHQRAQTTTAFTSTTTTTPTASTDTPKTPLLQVNFPDPCIILDPESGTWYAFATGAWPPPPPTNASNTTTTALSSSSNTTTSSSSPPPATNYTYKNIQAASAPSPSGPWTYLPHADPLPLPGGWTSGPGPISQVWAPSVVQLNASAFVLYYTALLAGNHSRFHCVGAATSTSVLGPYDPLPQPVACPLDKGGAIDPAGFLDPASGRRYLIYKVDGNALGEGGECNNGVEPVKGTPIVLQEVEAADGVTLQGDGVEVLDRDEKGGDGPLVEAPDVVWVGEGRYVLFYSNHCWDGPGYSVNYAVAEGNVSGREVYVWGGGGGGGEKVAVS